MHEADRKHPLITDKHTDILDCKQRKKQMGGHYQTYNIISLLQQSIISKGFSLHSP